MCLFTSLYNHPTELFPSPRGLKAGYLSFLYNASTHCHSSEYLSTAKHTCTQFIKRGTFSKRISRRSVHLRITINSSLLAEKRANTTLKIKAGIEKRHLTAGGSSLAGHWLSWIGPSSGVLAYRQTLNRPGFASGKWVMETFLGDFILSVEVSGKDLTATTRVANYSRARCSSSHWLAAACGTENLTNRIKYPHYRPQNKHIICSYTVKAMFCYTFSRTHTFLFLYIFAISGPDTLCL